MSNRLAGLPEQGVDPGKRADAVTVAFSSLTLDAGGFDHNQLIVKWSEGAVERTLYIKDAETIAAFRKAAPPELTAQLNEAAKMRGARRAC